MSKDIRTNFIQQQTSYHITILISILLLTSSKINVGQAQVNVVQQPTTKEQNIINSNKQQAAASAKQLFQEAQTLYRQATAESRKLSLEKAEQALKIWQSLEEKEEEANALNFIGLLYSVGGENKKALSYFESALTIWREKSNNFEQAQNLFLIGSVYLGSDEQETALSYFQKALTLYKAENKLTQVGQTLFIIGIVYDKLNQTKPALDSFRQALDIQRAQNDLPKIVSTLSNIGLTYTKLGETKKAVDVYNQALEIERQRKNLIGESDILAKISILQISLGENQKALATLNRALELRQVVQNQLPQKSQLSNLFNQGLILINLANVHSDLGNYQQALDYSNQAQVLMQKIGDRPKEANVLYLRSTIYNMRGEYKQQLATLNEALALQQAIPDRTGQISTLNSLAGIYRTLGDYKKALNFYNQALEIARQIKAPSTEAETLSRIAQAYRDLGNYTISVNYLNQALKIYEKRDDKYSIAQTLDTIAGVWQAASSYPKALEKYQQALQIWQQQEIPLGQLVSLLGMVRTYESLKDYPSALNSAKQALSLSRGQNKIIGATALGLMGRVYQATGDYQKSLFTAQQGASIFKKLGNKQGLANALINIGKTYNRLQDYQKAINIFNQEIELRQAIGDRFNEAEALYNVAINQRALGNQKAARSQIEKTIAIIEGIRSNVDRQELRASYFATVQKYYEFYIDLLMQLHKKEPSKGYNVLALQASERARARNLVELLNQARVDIRRNVDPKLVERERDLQQQLNATDFRRIQLLKGQYTNKQLEQVKQQIEAFVSDLDEVQAQIRSLSPEYASLTQSNQLDKLTLKLPEIQRQVLDDNTLLLQYSLGEERSYLWAVTKTGITGYEIPKRTDIEAAVNNFNQELRKTELEKIDSQVGIKLSQMLLGSVINQLGQKRLLIVGDGVLQTIPFAALPISENSSQNVPLLVKHEIVTLPSASTIGVLRSKLKGRQVAPKTIAVLADPVFNASDERLKVSQQPDSNNPSESTRFAEQACINVDRLKYSGEEAKDILSFVPENQYLKAVSFDASLATVNNSKLNQYQIVHFATHGCVNNDQPELSGVVLSLLNEKGTDIDGILRLHDIYNLNLSAELVTLSACKTGLGKDVKGEGLIGLTRGFMYAGAKRVVVSLWSVNDRTTADLMQGFYQQMLKNKLHPVAALREAQLEMWKQGKAPYYWAAFTVQGEWR